MSIKRLFTEHPATVGETYGQHFVSAMGFTLTMFRATFCCLIHAIFPFLFEKTGSDLIAELYNRMITNRSRLESARLAGKSADKQAVPSAKTAA